MLCKAEKAVADLQALNATLIDRIDDLDNRSRRVNIRIINVPENKESKADMVAFVSALLMEVMGNQFSTPPELDCAHRAMAQKPKRGMPPRPIIVAFHRYQDRERTLRWARQSTIIYQGHTLRFYPDLSASVSKKRAAFKEVKAALYRKRNTIQAPLPCVTTGNLQWGIPHV